jgi:hypothetical protein
LRANHVKELGLRSWALLARGIVHRGASGTTARSEPLRRVPIGAIVTTLAIFLVSLVQRLGHAKMHVELDDIDANRAGVASILVMQRSR